MLTCFMLPGAVREVACAAAAASLAPAAACTAAAASAAARFASAPTLAKFITSMFNLAIGWLLTAMTDSIAARVSSALPFTCR